MAQHLPRGLRNHNPLNIRHNPANEWQGMSRTQNDSSFVTFTSNEWGYRAAFVILRNWLAEAHRKRKKMCVRDIIARWAPTSDGNNVEAYTSRVLDRAVIKADEPISFTNQNQICRLLWAMAEVENGCLCSFGEVNNGYGLAKNS